MQKILLLTVFVSVFAYDSNSQIEKRNWIVGGIASYRSSEYNEVAGLTSKQIIFQLSGNLGYYFINKFAIGIKPEYDRTEVKQNANHQVVNSYGLGPFVRYYYLPIKKM